MLIGGLAFIDYSRLKLESPCELAKNFTLRWERPISGGFTSIDLYGFAAQENGLTGSGDCYFPLENESGTGDITFYRVFPSIEFVYNDMHRAYYNKRQQPAPHVMEINYCKEGWRECLFGGNQYCYIVCRGSILLLPV